MAKWAFTVVATFLLLGCTNTTELAKQAVDDSLYEKSEIEYRNLQSFPGKVVCGEFSTVSRWGQPSGSKRFIFVGDKVDTRPGDDDWMIFCSDDPASELYTRFGIDTTDKSNKSLPSIHGDLKELAAALQQYLSDMLFLPSQKQGLKGLVSSDGSGLTSRNFREGGYIDNIPADPWGRPYIYKTSTLGGVAPTYKLYTLGADGVKGGQGENADVGNWHLKYLDHIGKL